MATRFALLAHAYAHRGLWDDDTPENSLSAFRKAASYGFGAECDVHLSADGVPMVFHDFSLSRMTGHTAAVSALSAAELSELCLMSTAEPVPTLTECLAVMQGAPMLIELKTDPSTDIGALVEAVLTTIASHKGPVALMSFSEAAMRNVKRLSADIMRGLLLEPGQSPNDSQAQSAIRAIEPDFLGPSISDIAGAADFARTVRMPLASWTVRTLEQLNAARHHNIAPIFENLPTGLVSTPQTA